MREKGISISSVILVLAGNCCVLGRNPAEPNAPAAELVRYEQEFSSVRFEPARMGSRPGVAVIFEGTKDLHYYAKAESAPAPGFELKVQAKSPDFDFGKAVFPNWDIFTDPLGTKVEVFAGSFTVFLPMEEKAGKVPAAGLSSIEVRISGIACTSIVCLPPFEKTLRTSLDWAGRDSWKQISIQTAAAAEKPPEGPLYPIWIALALALVAGLAFNIMPCVWPVLPLIVMRIVEQARAGRRQAVTMGLAFCAGILLFFACFAVVNIVLRVSYATVLQLSDPFRNPVFVTVLATILVVMTLFMFGLFTITVPSSVAGRAGSAKGHAGAIGMGFLAAILSTPCSFGILGAVFAWAQAQPLWLASIVIIFIGLGMAVPYLVLTSMPGLLTRLPKAGRWMELFKQAVGFILLIIAIWLINTLPQERRIGTFYFAAALGVCLWIWGGWVSYGTAPLRRWLVRAAAVLLAVLAGMFLLTTKKQIIDWHSYDADLIQKTLQQSRPVLLKFTADWCLSCKVVERTVYSRRDIAKLLEQKNVLAVKADTTGPAPAYPATDALKNLYNEPGVPVTILVVPGKGEPAKWRGKLFADQLKQTLQKLPSE